MDNMDKYNSQWVSFHIRDHIKDGEILVQNTAAASLPTPTTAAGRSLKRRSTRSRSPPDGVGEIGASSRRGSEGRLDLFHDNDKICELHWENRGGEHANLVEVLDKSDKYTIEHGGWSSEAGPLGHVFVDVAEKKK
ncbi:hypothetical protein N7497_006742 [Penicillium chrysogenum]|nr:hypothetical protein N7497_006742 [Penicillium chrysogenum]